MPPRESLRPNAKAPFDQSREIPLDREDARWARVDRRSATRSGIADSDFSWSDAPHDPHSLANRRHDASDADDWGIAEDDAWVVDERERPAERSLAERDRARRERSARAARDGFAGEWEEEYQRAGSPVPDDGAAGPWANAHSSANDHSSAYDWAREFDDEFGRPGAEPIHASRIEPVPPVNPEPLVEPEPPLTVAAESGAAEPESDARDSSSIWEEPSTTTGSRRTVVITGRGADYAHSRRQGGWEAGLRVHERSSFKPDRVAMWAVLLGVILLLVATTSSHAAVLAAHLAH